MRKVIEGYCDPIEIWQEIDNNREFYANEVCFDGGFELKPLISNDLSVDAWKSMWMPKLFDQLTKIRNCIVHAREKRHENVILPTSRNNRLVSLYIPPIKRMAEQIAIKSTKS